MPNKNSTGYQIGRFLGKALILTLGFVIGKRWGRKPIYEYSFP